jgi:hypothetical protein
MIARARLVAATRSSLVAAALATVSSPAWAAEPKAAPSASAAASTTAPPLPPDLRVPSPKRAVPDYDGRGKPKATAGDVALWIPRVLLFPAWLVTEYAIRKPLGFAVATADINHWPVKLLEVFTFGPDDTFALFPTAFFDFGMRPSVGLYGYVDRLLHANNKLSYNAGFWGPSWLSFGVKDRVTVGKDSTISLGASWNRRPDQPFYGLGPRSHDRDLSRYGVSIFDAPLRYDLRFGGAFRLISTLGFRSARFHRGDCCDDPDMGARIAAGSFAAPPGYPGGYDALYDRIELLADSRPRRPANQTGARVDAYVEHGMDPRPSVRTSWVKWGGSAGAYLDLGSQRTIGLKASALFTESVTGETPFLEQASLGGFGLMRGYLQNRLVDRSAAVGEIEYRWPVWVFADGTLQGSVGNVFGSHLEGFAAELMRLSAAIGIRSNNSADHQLEMLLGFGTETFGEGVPITSVRVFVGGTNGF